jgi:hypothetical protein
MGRVHPVVVDVCSPKSNPRNVGRDTWRAYVHSRRMFRSAALPAVGNGCSSLCHHVLLRFSSGSGSPNISGYVPVGSDTSNRLGHECLVGGRDIHAHPCIRSSDRFELRSVDDIPRMSPSHLPTRALVSLRFFRSVCMACFANDLRAGSACSGLGVPWGRQDSDSRSQCRSNGSAPFCSTADTTGVPPPCGRSS